MRDRSAIREQQLGANHPDVATSLNNLAYLYKSQGRYGEAEPLFARSLAIKQKMLPENHPSLQLGWDNFRSFLQAVVQANRVAELSDHPLTQALLQDLQGAQNDA